MGTLITNVTVFTNDDQNTVLHDQAVAIDGTRIAAVGPEAELKAQFDGFTDLDGGGRLLMPGFTNAHMHFYGMYARGMALNHTPTNFHEILKYLWWALDKVLDDEAVYFSALIPAITAVRHGVTSIIDHHASPNACAGSLDKIEEALRQVGMRALLCYETSDRDGKEIRDAGLAENERYMRKCQVARAADPDHLFDGMMGLHASFTLDDDSLENAVAIAQGLNRGCHIHMLEDFVDETLTKEKYGRSVVERLAHFGVLDEKSITAHGIFLDDHSRKLLADSDTIVVHQAQSNMNNAVGRADVFALLEQGITVGLGTDGMTPDVRREIMTGYLMHKHHVSDNNLGWVEYETMAMKNNPAIYRRLTGQQVGRVEAGYLADLILVDYYPPTAFTGGNFWGHFLFGMVDADVDTTIINGRIVMHNKQMPGFDEGDIAAKSRVVARRVWQRYSEAG
ncbi:MAG: putative aminohydrolase SsnA [Ardenticatenaceae bacterium]|nr:putative aminohydrolase SsnA [Ardenticatenaceae bacterium]